MREALARVAGLQPEHEPVLPEVGRRQEHVVDPSRVVLEVHLRDYVQLTFRSRRPRGVNRYLLRRHRVRLVLYMDGQRSDLHPLVLNKLNRVGLLVPERRERLHGEARARRDRVVVLRPRHRQRQIVVPHLCQFRNGRGVVAVIGPAVAQHTLVVELVRPRRAVRPSHGPKQLRALHDCVLVVIEHMGHHQYLLVDRREFANVMSNGVAVLSVLPKRSLTGDTHRLDEPRSRLRLEQPHDHDVGRLYDHEGVGVRPGYLQPCGRLHPQVAGTARLLEHGDRHMLSSRHHSQPGAEQVAGIERSAG